MSQVTVRWESPDDVEQQVRALLQLIADHAAGTTSWPARPETEHVDLKEEAGRAVPGAPHDRTPGARLPGRAHNDIAAQALLAPLTCLANTAGGGALILGVRDDGDLIGTDLDPGWLRQRVFELSGTKLTVGIAVVRIAGVRLLVLNATESLEPLAHHKKIRWRVGDRCVEIDAATWWERHNRALGYDWSAAPSGHTLTDARATALELARDALRRSGESTATELAEATDADLLRRLNVTTASGHLTRAGALLFVGRDTPALDYLRRDLTGGDSLRRVNRRGRSVLEELAEVEAAIAAYNPLVHLPNRLLEGQVTQLPERAVREAIVNGLAHRDWQVPNPTVVEHVGARLTVQSPGGFYGGVNPHNIITHPSQSRNRSLTEAFAALRLAELEGIGVDRMVREMIRMSYPPPDIEELPGPLVRTVLVARTPDPQWIAMLHALRPANAALDLDILLLCDELAHSGWIDRERAMPLLQRSAAETDDALTRLTATTYHPPASPHPVPLAEHLTGTPAGTTPVYRLHPQARQALATRTTPWRTANGRRALATHYATHRGRISTTELANLTGIAAQNVNTTLKDLTDDGTLTPGRSTRRGRGMHYLPAPPHEPPTPPTPT